MMTMSGMAVALFWAGMASAQTAAVTETDSSDGLQEITVTAQRRSENLQTTPIAVSAFSQDTLKDRQALTISDIAVSVPNVSMTSTLAGQGTTTAFIRGAGQADGGFSFTEAAVGIYVDDVYHARLSGTNLEFNDVERVEVLRGPQGTLYGRNNLTGAIKIVRKQADGTTFGTAEVSYGSRDYNSQKATISTAIVPDKLAVIASGFHVGTDGYIPAVTLGGKLGAREQWGGRVGLAFIGSEQFDAKLNVAYTHDKGDGAIPISYTDALVPTGGALYKYVSPLRPTGLNKQLSTDLSMSVELGAATLRSITGFIDATDDFRFDVFGGQATATPGVYSVGFDRRSHTKSQQFSQELQLLGDVADGSLKYILGAYYFNEDIKQRFNDVLVGFAILPDNVSQKTDSYAAFGQLTYELSDTVSATGGLRYTHEEKRIFGTMSNGLFLFPQTLTAVSNGVTFNALSPKVEIDWKPAQGLFGYASFSRGFQSGGFNASAIANPTAFRIPYDAQTVSAYEVGVKAELFDRSLRINADYFYNRFGNLQTNVVLNSSVITQNAGTAEVHGPEVEVTLVPVRGLTFYGSGSRLFDRYIKLDPTSQAAVAKANDLPRMSKWQAQVGFSFDLPLENLGASSSAGSFVLNGDYSYRSPYNVNPALIAIAQVGTQELVNGSFGWKATDNKVNLTLSARNLLNERFYLSGSNYGVNRKSKLVNQPRLVRLVLGVNF